MFICRKWGSTDVRWKDANWLWSECQLVEEIISIIGQGGVDASKIAEELWRDEKDREKKKRFIRLICKVKNETYNEEKEVKDFKIKIEDVKLVVRAVAGIELEIKE
jgi:hypothetical protein